MGLPQAPIPAVLRRIFQQLGDLVVGQGIGQYYRLAAPAPPTGERYYLQRTEFGLEWSTLNQTDVQTAGGGAAPWQVYYPSDMWLRASDTSKDAIIDLSVPGRHVVIFENGADEQEVFIYSNLPWTGVTAPSIYSFLLQGKSGSDFVLEFTFETFPNDGTTTDQDATLTNLGSESFVVHSPGDGMFWVTLSSGSADLGAENRELIASGGGGSEGAVTEELGITDQWIRLKIKRLTQSPSDTMAADLKLYAFALGFVEPEGSPGGSSL